MGLFLAASGVVGCSAEKVQKSLSEYVASIGGNFELRAGTTNDRGMGVIRGNGKNSTILFPEDFVRWDDVSKALSLALHTPVFSFHIHDGDLWMFVAFENGVEKAWFNPLPDYWGEITDDERNQWRGDAEAVSKLVPGLSASSVQNYFREWTDDLLNGDKKAYEDDEFPFGADWQLTDFMQRIGFDYPIDETGKPTGETFYLKIRRKRARAGSDSSKQSSHQPRSDSPSDRSHKPWWKLW